MNHVLFGIDQLCLNAGDHLNKRFALVTNNAALMASGLPGRVALLKAGITITKLFSPEHGLTAKGEDGSFQANHTDALTGLPVISLYGDHFAPTETDLKGTDAVLFDIPDCGCRFYTYLWTMTHVMESCAKWGKPLIVLDRPNPLGGNLAKAEGPMLDEENCSSFIGRWNIPVRHSCSLGELAGYFAATRLPNLDLTVIKVANWQRAQTVQESGWRFVPTSPAITDTETALLYPGMGLLEGINVNEGWGTATPFKKAGAPWIDADELSEAFNHLQLAGIISNPVIYVPADGLYAGENCNGLCFTVKDPINIRPVYTGLQLMRLILALYPNFCRPRFYQTVANPTGAAHLGKLTGVYNAFDKLKDENYFPATTVYPQWVSVLQPHLLYV